MNTNEQINALVKKYGISETVKQEIVKIVNDAYEQGRYDLYNELEKPQMLN